MGGVIFPADWYKEFLALQRNPKAFADRKKLTREDLCMDMLKDLYSDSVSTQCKCHIMVLYQEHESYLIENEVQLEQVVGSLENLYEMLKNNKENRILKSKTIITMTTLILCWENTDVTRRLSGQLRDMLLVIIFSEDEHYLLRSAACQCLAEMEKFYPGFLNSQVENLLSAVGNHQLSPIQNIVYLLSICLKYKACTDDKSSGNSKLAEKALVAAGQKVFTSQKNEVQIHHIIGCIMDILPSLNSTYLYFVLKNLKYVVERTPEVLPVLFKMFLPKLIMSSDVLQFHLAFDLLRTFQDKLFSAQEEKLLINQLLVNIKQPLLNHPHHLLYLDWLRSFLKNKDVLSSKLPASCLEVLIPGPFDDPLIQEKKIDILSLYLEGFNDKATCGQFLMSCLMGLKRQLFTKPLITTVSAFFRALYFMCQSAHYPIIQSDIQRLIIEIMSSSPCLAPFVLNFLKCMKKDSEKSNMCDDIFSLLVNHVVNLTPKQCAEDIDYFLSIFETAVIEAPHVSKPQTILRQLKNVLSEPSVLQRNTWEVGHDILSLCCIFLKHHDIEVLYHDLGEVLYLVMNNIKNCDCQDRAKQYYSALTSLPQSRIKELFKNQKLEQFDISLTTIVSGTETLFFSRNTKLEEPIFELIRIERTNKKLPTVFDPSESVDNAETLKENYMEYISSKNFRPVVKIPFILKHLENAPEEFLVSYCVVITSVPGSDGPKISDVEVPVLKKSEVNEGVSVEIEFIPKVPFPVVFELQVCFTSYSGSSYRFELPPITVKFEDFFSLLPVNVQKHNLRGNFFEQLWNDNKRFLTKFHIDINDKDLSALVEHQWQPFVMYSKNDTYSIAIFLPPATHLLMTLVRLNSAVLATVVTEQDLLPFVSCYMMDVSKIRV